MLPQQILFYNVFLIVWGTAFLSADLQLFSVDVFAPRIFRAKTFCRRYVLALKHFAANEQEFASFCTRHGLFFLTNFFVEAFAIGNRPVFQ